MSEDFEDGLAGWTTSIEMAFEGGIHDPWKSVASAPAGNGDPHPGGVAYGPAPDEGQCTNGEGDFSSRDSIASPVVQLPSPALGQAHVRPLRRHGGRLRRRQRQGEHQRWRVRGHPRRGVHLQRADNAHRRPANTNPLAGEVGFTGTDGGEVNGSWGESQVDLDTIGAEPGDTVQVRFDIGRDGCGGIEGWYIDNVQVVECKLISETKAVHRPEPSTFGTASAAKVTVGRVGSVGGSPEGTVSITDAKGKELGSATLAGGKASVALPADLPVGANKLTATYSGSDSLATSTAAFTATVVGKGVAASTTTAKVKPAKPRFKRDFKVVVKVAAEGTTPTGRGRGPHRRQEGRGQAPRRRPGGPQGDQEPQGGQAPARRPLQRFGLRRGQQGQAEVQGRASLT